MKKYEYKMIMRDNETVWKEVGVKGSGWGASNSEALCKYVTKHIGKDVDYDIVFKS